MKLQVKLNLSETSVKYYEKLLLKTNLFIRMKTVLFREVEPLPLNIFRQNFVISLVSHGITTMGSLNLKIQVVCENDCAKYSLCIARILLLYTKQLLDEIFVISGIIKVEVSVISRAES